MKNITTILLIVLGTVTFAQQRNITQLPQKIGLPAEPVSQLKIEGVSGGTALLILKMQDVHFREELLVSDSIQERYSIINVNGAPHVNCFILASNEANLSKYGYLEGSNQGNIKTGLIPVENLEMVALDSEVTYIEIGEKAEPTLNEALAATWVNDVHQGAGGLSRAYTGEDVVVGIIDIGFDYTHPSFYDESFSNYRIKRVWEQDATHGQQPSGFAYGRELIGENAILNAMRDVNNQSHGTHVAGIAAGSGAGTNGDYKGVAFNSDIILVATSGNMVKMIDGISYIQNYANSVNKPCVINLSWGGHSGPHDGTSSFDQFCDGIVGKGLLLVGAAGNEGSDPLYIGKSFSPTDTLLNSFVQFPSSSLGTNGNTTLEIWGRPQQQFWIAVSVFNSNTNSYEDWTPYISATSGNTYNYVLQDNDFFFPDDCIVDISTGTSPLNSKPNVRIEIDHTAQDDSYRWAMIHVFSYNTTVDIWANPVTSHPGKAHFTNYGYGYPWVNGSTSSTVGEIGGTGNSMISVGAYTTKNTYTNLSNSTQNIPAFAPIDEIAPFSSHGPTADKRTKPDITAPGNVIVAPVSRFDNNFQTSSSQTVEGVTDGNNNWYYGALEGTSMAAPMVTGILALWLEAYPDLDLNQALDLLKDNAYTDNFTGTIPSTGDNTWGWGKIDAEYGLLDLESKIPQKPTISPQGDITLCQGESETLSAPSGFAAYEWNNSSSTQSITVSSNGSFSVRVENNEGFFSPWSDSKSVVVNPNPSTPSITIDGNTLTSSPEAAYQWYFEGNVIPNANQQSHTAQNSGEYHVEVFNAFECSTESSPVNITVTGVGLNDLKNNEVSIFPNPNSGNFIINSSFSEIISIDILDATGRIISSYPRIVEGSNEIELRNVSSGMYFIRYSNGERIKTQKLLVW